MPVELPFSLMPFIVPAAGMDRFLIILPLNVLLCPVPVLIIPSIEPVDTAAVKLIPSIVLVLNVPVTALPTEIPLRVPLAAAFVTIDIELLLILQFAIPVAVLLMSTETPVLNIAIVLIVFELIFAFAAVAVLLIPKKSGDEAPL